MTEVQLSIEDVEQLTHRALRSCKTNEMNCRSVTRSIVAAELDGLPAQGLAAVPAYCEHARSGKINGNSQPELIQLAPASLRVDALDGFAHPAIDIGLDALVPMARQQGIAALGIVNSYNSGAMAYHAEKLACHELLALGFANTPVSSLSPGKVDEAVLGNNPIACAVPDGTGSSRIIIDQRNTPSGNDSQGLSLALLVEVLAAGITGANLGLQASSYNDNDGGSPRTGQFFLAINTSLFCSQQFQSHIGVLLDAVTVSQSTDLPDNHRKVSRAVIAEDGVTISKQLHQQLIDYTQE